MKYITRRIYSVNEEKNEIIKILKEDENNTLLILPRERDDIWISYKKGKFIAKIRGLKFLASSESIDTLLSIIKKAGYNYKEEVILTYKRS